MNKDTLNRLNSDVMDTVTISVQPQNALIDERITIQIKGLEQFQKITVHSRVTENRVKFASYGCFKANSNGVVNIAQDTCIDGTYQGKDAMGLFWSAKPEPGSENKRLLKSDVTEPMVFAVSVLHGFFTWDDLYSQDFKPVILARTEIRRWYKSADVKRVEVHDGRLRGTLFIPKGQGPFPAVVDMFGGRGGLVEFRAALLASRGFLTLALAFFEHEDLPKIDELIPFDYFKEAAGWLVAHPLTSPGGIGAVGVSFGAIFACAMATYIKEVVAAVMINGSPYGRLFVYADRSAEFEAQFRKHVGLNRVIQTEEGVHLKLWYKHSDTNLTESWESDARFLCIIGGDDQSIDPTYIEYWYSKWPLDQRHRIEVIKYPDAGHLIEPPYSPHHRVTGANIPFKSLFVWGGRPKGHAHAQEDSWRRLLQFLRENVPKKDSYARSQL